MRYVCVSLWKFTISLSHQMKLLSRSIAKNLQPLSYLFKIQNSTNFKYRKYLNDPFSCVEEPVSIKKEEKTRSSSSILWDLIIYFLLWLGNERKTENSFYRSRTRNVKDGK